MSNDAQWLAHPQLDLLDLAQSQLDEAEKLFMACQDDAATACVCTAIRALEDIR
jgi:hypothetical protein